MPLISDDNRRDRKARSAGLAQDPAPAKTAPKPPTKFPQSSHSRPTLLKAAVNAGKAVLRDHKMLRSARPETIAYREGKCAVCDLAVEVRGANRCGHAYLDVTIGRVKVEDIRGCGCKIDAKIKDPDSRCPKDPPEWVEEDVV